MGGGAALRSFVYDNDFPWPAAADNGGASLVLVAPRTNPDHGDPLNWRASPTPGPGSSDTLPFAAWQTANSQPDPVADTDNDGLNAFMEYALGGLPGESSQALLPAMVRQPDGSALLTITRSLLADDAAWEVQNGNDLSGWTAASVTLVDRSLAAGRESFTFSVPAAAFDDPRRFWRLHVTLRQP